MLTIDITIADHCRSVESFLMNLMPQASVAYVHKLIRGGKVVVNGDQVQLETMLQVADSLSLKESARMRELVTNRRPAIDLLYEDSRIVAVNKRPGLQVHWTGDEGGEDLVETAGVFFATRGAVIRFRPVNRLDKGTSGVVILAKSSQAAGMFGRMLKEEGLDKLYLALVDGNLPDEGSITFPVEGKESETRFRLLYASKRGSLVALWPLTGRMHQIRQHLSAAGAPIVGDRRYGGRMLPGLEGHGLHSFRTAFAHPETGQRLELAAPLPAGFVTLLQKIAGDGFGKIVQSLARLSPTIES
jgi:23S rRNA pseudouridine955/2504/2580 synthase